MGVGKTKDVSSPKNITSKEIRRYYVGATRAKVRLFIHTNTLLFDGMPADEHHISHRQYDMPEEIILQLSHRDVNLGFFKTRKKDVLALRAGQSLRFANNYLYESGTDKVLAKLSQKMQEELKVWIGKNYDVESASIRFIVAWRPKDAPQEEKEHAVLLIDLSLKKNSN